jgi:hypothetical protein
MSILPICSISSMTRFAAAVSSSRIISSKTVGTICHETPNLSFSQPQGPSREEKIHRSTERASASAVCGSERYRWECSVGHETDELAGGYLPFH